MESHLSYRLGEGNFPHQFISRSVFPLALTRIAFFFFSTEVSLMLQLVSCSRLFPPQQLTTEILHSNSFVREIQEQESCQKNEYPCKGFHDTMFFKVIIAF